MNRLTLLRAALAAVILGFSSLALSVEAPQEVAQQLIQIDINQADAAAIAAALDGIGVVKAEEIVAYRTMFGNFRSIDELLAVKGIGEATVERNRERIIIVNN